MVGVWCQGQFVRNAAFLSQKKNKTKREHCTLYKSSTVVVRQGPTLAGPPSLGVDSERKLVKNAVNQQGKSQPEVTNGRKGSTGRCESLLL